MIFHNFSQLHARVQEQSGKKRVAVVAAAEQHVLQAVIQAYQANIVEPVLFGNADKISALLDSLGASVPPEAIIHTDTPTEAATRAVKMAHHHEIDILMKGRLQTAELLQEVVHREYGLRTGRIMSHLAFLEIPTYHKLLAITDSGMVLYPNLEEKQHLIENAVGFMRDMGYSQPKVAALAVVETVNPKMQESVDAFRLKQMNQEGLLGHCLVEGPISYDLAMSKESARIKRYDSPITGEPDILLVPNITTGNLMAKALIYSGGAKMAGVIVGAQVPVVLTSRGSSAEEKYSSLVLAASSASQ